MIRVGVIGVGSMGQNHARLYSQLACELVGIADVDQNKGRKISEKYNTDYYSDYHDLLTEVEAISIVVPTTLHYAIAMDFLNEGIHCLIEKPIATDLDQAQDLIEAANNNKAMITVGHIEHFNPAVTRLKQLMNEGAIGQPLMISARRVGPYVPRVRDVGIIVDSATHDIGVINYLVGRTPINVNSKTGHFIHPLDDHGIIVLDYQGIIATIEVNWFSPHKVRTLTVTGSEGTAYLDYINQTIILHNGPKSGVAEITKAEPLKLELEHFLDCINSGKQLLVTGEEAKEILKIALQASNRKVR